MEHLIRRVMHMRKSGLFAILLAAALVTGCGSGDSAYLSESSSGTYSASSSRAAGGVSNSYEYEYATEAAADTAYDYDGGSASDIASVYDEAMLKELDPEYGVDDEGVDSGNSSSADDDIAEVDTSKKVIRNMNYSVETTDLDALDQEIQTKVNELGGYIESSSKDGGTTYDDGYYLGDDGNTYYDTSYAARSGNTRQYRYAYYTVRIPAANLDQFAEAVENGANVLSQSTSTQDITSSYVDTDSRRKSLEEELQILNDMAEDAETVDELIQIESQRSDVRYQLENIKSQLKSMDDQVAYSTVYISVTEVTVLTDTTARDLSWQERIVNGFTTSCEQLIETSQEIVIWIASNLPMIVFYIVIAIILLVILRLVIHVIAAILGTGKDKNKRRGKRRGKAAANITVDAAAKDSEPAADPKEAGATAADEPEHTDKTI